MQDFVDLQTTRSGIIDGDAGSWNLESRSLIEAGPLT